MAHLLAHPLRDSLSNKDWKRIQKVLDKKIAQTEATLEEIEAAHDVFYDAVAAKLQTHLGSLILQ